MKTTMISTNYSATKFGLAAILFMLCIVWAGTADSACIQVTSPNGEEAWVPGASKPISWTYDNAQSPGSHVKVELLKGGILNATISTSAGIGSNGNGSRNWTVPAQQAGGDDYSIRVTSLTKPICTDTSDSNFHIYTLKITSPNGGEILERAKNTVIKWDSPGWPPGEKIRLELWQGANLIGNVVNSLSGGALLWEGAGRLEPSMPATWAPPGSGYKIKIVSLTTSLSDMSDGTFTILPPTVRITSPNGGENWKYNTPKAITWTSSGIGVGELVKLELLKGGSVIGSLGTYASYTAQNSVNWPVGHTYNPYAYTPVGNDFKVRITTMISSSNVSDESDGFFTVAPGEVRLGVPNGGEIWKPGEPRQITWKSEGCDDASTVKLELLQLTTECLIANPISTKQGSYSWTVGQCAYGSTRFQWGDNYKVRIHSNSGCGPTNVEDTSARTFTISKPDQLPVKVPAYKK